MANRIREYDWSTTPLGPTETWPQSLRTVVDLLLGHSLPMALLWGPQNINIYNDAYRVILGGKHPAALGEALHAVWPEQPSIKILLQRVWAGETVTYKNAHYRNDRDSAFDAWHDFTLNPVRDEAGSIAGALVTVLGTTAGGLADRQRDTAKADLRESDEHYRILFNSMDEGFSIIKVLFDSNDVPIDYRFLQVNPAFEKHTGLVGAVGRTVLELVPKHEKHWFEIYGSIALTGEPARFEDQAAALGRWYDVFAFRIGYPEERRVAVFFRDISPRKRAETALRDSEERFRAFVAARSDVVYRMSPDWTQMRQLEGQELLRNTLEPSETWMDRYIHPEDQPFIGAAIQQAIASKSMFELEHRVHRADGTLGWILSRAVPILDDDGEVKEWLGAARDVTDRVVAQRALRESEKRQMFLLKLSDALRPLADPQAIEGEACRLMAEWLNVDRAYYVEINEITGIAKVKQDFVRSGAFSLAGAHRVADFEWSVAILRRGACHVVADTQNSSLVPEADRPALAALDIIACVGAPLIKQGRLVGALCVTEAVQRDWLEGEVEIVREVAERVWAAIERAQAEAALRESEERFRSFGENTSDTLWIVNAETRQLEYLSPAFETMWGESRKQIMADIGRWLTLVHPEDRSRVAQTLSKLLEGGVQQQQYRIVRSSDRAVRWILDTGFEIRDAEGRIHRVAGIAQDITARVTAERELARNESRLRSLIEGIPQLVWQGVNGGKRTWSSPQWSAYTGLTEEESLDFGWLDALHQDDRKRAMDAWRTAAITGDFDVEHRLWQASEREYRWFATRAVPVRDEEGSIIEWLGTSTDIEELRAMQDRQHVLLAELQHRTLNLMGVIRSLADATLRNSTSLDDFRAKFRDRIGALARVQSLLSRLKEGERVTFDELIRSELTAAGALGDDDRRVTLNGSDGIALRSSTLQTFAMAIHELTTNALKYGALNQPNANLEVSWWLEPTADDSTPWLHVDWRESGVTIAPASSSSRGTGQGRILIEEALPYQLGARTTYRIEPNGVRCSIALPVSEERARKVGGNV